jgi:3-isopropylmalate/(R)-2-methylmalate dehydratase small subunit
VEKFTQLSGVAAPMPAINIDTDKIFPAVYLKTIKRTGLGNILFQEIRYNADGSENPDFVLNQPPYRQARILVAGDNFGCGSSREHAPWALLDFGIRCVIAPSFADIFFNNCFKNGILPIALPQDIVDQLLEDAKKGANAVLTIDLESQTISRPDGEKVHFDVDAFRKHCLLNGLDDIGITEQKTDAIGGFEAKNRAARPWQWGLTTVGMPGAPGSEPAAKG